MSSTGAAPALDGGGRRSGGGLYLSTDGKFGIAGVEDGSKSGRVLNRVEYRCFTKSDV